MRKRLEDLLDVRAHAQKAARWLRSPEKPMKLHQVADRIRFLAPEFPLRDPRNQLVWADVMAAHSGLDPYDIVGVYRDYLREKDEMDEEFARSPMRGWVYYRDPSGAPAKIAPESFDPVALVLQCRDLEASGARDARFEIYGQGKVILGERRWWYTACSCGHMLLCGWHGEPRRNKPEWYSTYDPQLWPWVGVIPWFGIHEVPWRKKHK